VKLTILGSDSRLEDCDLAERSEVEPVGCCDLDVIAGRKFNAIRRTRANFPTSSHADHFTQRITPLSKLPFDPFSSQSPDWTDYERNYLHVKPLNRSVLRRLNELGDRVTSLERKWNEGGQICNLYDSAFT